MGNRGVDLAEVAARAAEARKAASEGADRALLSVIQFVAVTWARHLALESPLGDDGEDRRMVTVASTGETLVLTRRLARPDETGA